jgi:hypothetical protein
VTLAALITGGQTNGAGGFNSTAQPALADLDNDGLLEVVIGSNVLRSDGSRMPGWTNGQVGAVNALSAAIGEFDANVANGLEVVLGRDAWRANGTRVPVTPLSSQLSPVILGDMGDGFSSVLGSVRNSQVPGVHAFSRLGSPWWTWPKSLYGNTGDAGAPVIGDFDGDGFVDTAAAITDASYGGVLAIWNEPGINHDEKHHWPMLGHDPQHSGLYTVPPPNRPGHAIVTVVGDAAELHWQDRSAVEGEYVVERSPSGAAFTFVPLVALPAGTTSHVDSSPGAGAASYRIRATRIDPTSGRVIRSAFAAAEPGCFCDLNGDNAVSIADLSLLLSQFGATSGATYDDGDIDGDGDVDLNDLTLLLSSFGTSCA